MQVLVETFMTLTRQQILANIQSVKDEIIEARKELFSYQRKNAKLLIDDADVKFCIKLLAYLQELEDELGEWKDELARRDEECFGELQPCG